MKRAITWSWTAVLAALILAVPAGAAEQSPLKSRQDKVSYAVGVSIIRNLKQQGVVIDTDLMVRGMRDALSGGSLLMTEEDLRATLNAYQNELREKYTLAMKEIGEANTKEGEAFLAANGKKEGVVTLPSGLQYKVLKAGTGKKPTDTDTVECHYRGTLINGTEFDSSYRAGKPLAVKVSGVIAGWTEALKLMPVGSTWQLFIPPQLAYGAKGAAPRIAPNATLIFEVELLRIK
ncbi:MAG: hypothetical protein CVU61_14310 [Deltaproteobacteria bacterium HGW-Deltaproteobacteria-19]|nr:MAG: hypothetical protein CVU61_14310 [Deltaproteobacteria bacterium HGW-Deltaproteobacteria-19]